ncbi:MAG: hypothetical protein ACLFRZ_03440 [Rhodosalinus sp.]
MSPSPCPDRQPRAGRLARPPPDHSEALPALCDRVQATPAPATAQPLDEGAWELRTDAPDKAAQAVLSPTAPGGLEL